jgi:TIR domain
VQWFEDFPVNTKSIIALQLKRFAKNLFGYDFFVSFKLGRFPLGAQSYASDLARRLREEDYTVFFSEEEAPPGEQLSPTLTKALHHSRIMIVILNEGALLHSKWVRHEVEEFRRRHPKRPVVAINIDRAIEKYAVQADTAAWLGPEGRIWLDEANEAAKNGTASAAVVKRLAITPNFLRSNSRLRWTEGAIAAALLFLTGWAFIERDVAKKNEQQARAQTQLALANESRALAALAQVANGFTESIYLALAAWPRTSLDMRPRLKSVLDTLSFDFSRSVPAIREFRHDRQVWGALLNKDETKVLSWSQDGTLRLWDLEKSRQILPTMKHDRPVVGAIMNRAETRFLSWSYDGTLRQWDAITGAQIGPAMKHDGEVYGALVTQGEDRTVSWSKDKTIRIWDLRTGKQIGPSMKFDDSDDPLRFGALLDKSEKRILSWGGDGTIRLWDIATGAPIGSIIRHKHVTGALLSQSENRILSWASDGTIKIWGVANCVPIGPTLKHSRATTGISPAMIADDVSGAVFTRDELHIVSWSYDHTVRLWDALTGEQIGPAMEHGGVVRGAVLTKRN